MDERQRKAFDAWIRGGIDDIQFSDAYGIAVCDWPAEISRLLADATATKDAEMLEYATLLHARFGGSDDLCSVFNDLLTQTWHTCHEYMIRYLQDHPSESSVEPLRNAIALKDLLGYLDYDDYGAYYKKCLWALAVNPSPDAIDAIKDCARSKNDVLREQALYRLQKLGLNTKPTES